MQTKTLEGTIILQLIGGDIDDTLDHALAMEL
jgi:hypothetical protein